MIRMGHNGHSSPLIHDRQVKISRDVTKSWLGRPFCSSAKRAILLDLVGHLHKALESQRDNEGAPFVDHVALVSRCPSRTRTPGVSTPQARNAWRTPVPCPTEDARSEKSAEPHESDRQATRQFPGPPRRLSRTIRQASNWRVCQVPLAVRLLSL